MRDTVERSQLRSAAEPLRSARLSQLMFVFHWRLVTLTLDRFRSHPLTPLPMVRL